MLFLSLWIASDSLQHCASTFEQKILLSQALNMTCAKTLPLNCTYFFLLLNYQKEIHSQQTILFNDTGHPFCRIYFLVTVAVALLFRLDHYFVRLTDRFTIENIQQTEENFNDCKIQFVDVGHRNKTSMRLTWLTEISRIMFSSF